MRNSFRQVLSCTVLLGSLGILVSGVASAGESAAHEKPLDHNHEARKANPYTIMPPFRAHEVLTADELEKVVTHIHSL